MRAVSLCLACLLLVGCRPVQRTPRPPIASASLIAIMTGDSIEAGHGSGYKAPMDDGGPGGNIACELGYQMQKIIGPNFSYQDCARGSTTWNWIVKNVVPILSFSGTREVWIHTGVNDIQQGRLWSDVQADMDAVYRGTKAQLFIDEILPDSNFDDAKAATVRDFNAKYNDWAADKPRVHIVHCWEAFGELRPSTGKLDNLSKKYDIGDKVHINEAGAVALARMRATGRKAHDTNE